MINENHPKYPEFVKKIEALCDEEDKELEEARAKFSGGRDGPSTAIRKKYWQKIKALQKEYAFLYEDK
jgi:hypothetical protein